MQALERQDRQPERRDERLSDDDRRRGGRPVPSQLPARVQLYIIDKVDEGYTEELKFVDRTRRIDELSQEEAVQLIADVAKY